MKDEPDIIKKLREEEKLGILGKKTSSQGLNITQKNNENYEEINRGTNNIFQEPLTNIEKHIKIEKKDETFRSIFENYAFAVTIADEKEKIISWNKHAEDLFLMNEKDLSKKDVSTFYPLEEWKKIRKEHISKKGLKFKIETKMIKKTGDVFDAELSLFILKGNGGKTVGSIGLIRDITSLKTDKKKIIESKNMFRDIFDATSDLLFYLEKGVILDINNATLEISGFVKRDFVGKKFSDLKKLFSKDDLNKHCEAIESTIKGIKIKDYESDLKSKDEHIYKFLFSVDYIKDNDNVKGVLIRGKDITQRQRAWDELVKLEEKYRVLAETSADGVVTIDPLGRLTYVNPSFEKLLGKRKSQILATLFREYLSDESVYFFQQITIDAREKNEKIENIELELVHLNGDIIPIEVNVAPYKKNKEFAGLVCTIRDITERRRVENELKKSERLKTEFMNIVAHELKSPVTPIKGYLDLIISDKNTSEQTKSWAKVSLRNAERLLKLVNDILDVSRLDTDTMRFEMEKLDITQILNEISEDMRPAVESKKIKFITKIPKDLPNIIGDKYRLSQVFKNLFTNAVKFTDNGSITLDAKKKNDHILISIKDTGVGVSKDEIKKIFNKFYQAYTGDDRKNEGTGLGLYICKEIIQKHNGDIWAESQIGKSSHFYVKLPYLHKMVVNLKN
jgi:PAS domain S-box-containing protein